MAKVIITVPNYTYPTIFDQNNFVRTLNISTLDLNGIGTIEEQICEYILSLPEEERTIQETDSKWNVIVNEDIENNRIFNDSFSESFS